MSFLAFDTETTGLSRWKGKRMFFFSTCDFQGETGAFRLERANKPKRHKIAMRELKRIWAPENRKRIRKVMHNARFDLGMVMSKLNIPLAEMRKHGIEETMALAHLMQSHHPNLRLEELAWELFNYPADADAEVKHYKTQAEDAMLACPEWKCDEYGENDAERTMLLFRGLRKLVKENGYWDIYEMEREMVWTTLAIEERGIMLKIPRCHKLIEWLEEEMDLAAREYQEIVGRRASINDNEVRRFLYRDLEIEPFKWTKKSKQPSVDKYVLSDVWEQTKHPAFQRILKYKAYQTGLSMARGYLELCDSDGIIHPSIHPYGTRTGRESCKKPNLQNVPTETKLNNPFPVPLRKAFGPRPGYVNYHLDYSGIQARIFISMSQDPEMLEIMRTGGDPHEEAAKEFYGSKFTRISKKRDYMKWKKHRDAAKNGNFAVAFGGGVLAVARQTGLDYDDAKRGYERYKERFTELAKLNRRYAQEVRERGYVHTLFGRRLYVNREKPYVGTVYADQGTEAGVQKRAQIRVEKILNDMTGGECGIILPVHDEVIIEVPRDRIEEFNGDVLPVVRKAMIDFPEISVPLEVEAEVSTRDWNTTHEVPIPT